MPMKINEHRTSWTHNIDGTLIDGMEDEYARFLGEEKKQLKFNFNNKKGET
jgi:hypothetical protein